MAQYAIVVWGPSESRPHGGYGDEQTQRDTMAAIRAFNDRLREAGSLVFVGGLEGSEATTVADARGGETVISDGPYIDAKEGMNGLWIIEASDLDEALVIASEASRVCDRPLEVRPFASA